MAECSEICYENHRYAQAIEERRVVDMSHRVLWKRQQAQVRVAVGRHLFAVRRCKPPTTPCDGRISILVLVFVVQQRKRFRVSQQEPGQVSPSPKMSSSPIRARLEPQPPSITTNSSRRQPTSRTRQLVNFDPSFLSLFRSCHSLEVEKKLSLSQ